MTESEVWDLLGAEIERYAATTKDTYGKAFYLCHIIDDVTGIGFHIPWEIRLAMRDRFRKHHDVDNRLNTVTYSWNPPSWYRGPDTANVSNHNMNEWRILFCYAMAWEAWEEEQQTT